MENIYQNYRIERSRDYPVWIIRAKGQGQVPVKLGGMYTSVPEAKRDIDRHLASTPVKKKVVKKNGENDNTSRD